jgi:hypothetical protein
LGNWQRRTLSSEDLVERLSIRKMGTSSVIESRLGAVSVSASNRAGGS